MAVAQQSAAETLRRLGIQIPGTENVVSGSVMEQSPSLAFGATPDEQTGFIDEQRAMDAARNAPGVAQHQAIIDRDAEAMRAGFQGGHQEAAEYGRNQMNLDRQAEIERAVRQGETAAQYNAQAAEARLRDEEGQRAHEMQKLQMQIDAAQRRDLTGTVSDPMYRRLDEARSARSSWNPLGLIDRMTGKADSAYKNALRAVIDRRGQLQLLDNFARELSQIPGNTLAEKLQNAGGDDLDDLQREYVGAVLGLPE